MVTIHSGDDRLELRAPFHPALPFRAKQIGGRWRGADTGWIFALEHEDAVRSICSDIWGVDGREETARDAVTLRVEVDERTVVRSVFTAYSQPIYLVGREIADALKSRKTARPGRGIRFLVGRPCCLAHAQVYETYVPDGSVFVIRDVPRMAVPRFEQATGEAGSVQIDAAA